MCHYRIKISKSGQTSQTELNTHKHVLDPISGDMRKKEEIWLRPMSKCPIPAEMSNGQSDNRRKRVPVKCETKQNRSKRNKSKRNETKKRRYLTQSYDKRPYTHRKIKKNAPWQHKKATKTSITQWLRTDLGRSVGVTAVTQLVWLNRFTSAQPSH